MTKRAGRTVKLSISLDKRDVEILEKRARKSSGGNLSAAVAEMIRMATEREGRWTLASWLGEGRDDVSPAEMEAVRAEWRGTSRRRRKKAA